MFSASDATYSIQARGTYLIEGSSVFLYPEYGATVGGGTAVITSRILMLDRYPGRWRFSK